MKNRQRRFPLSYQRFATIVKMFCHGFRIKNYQEMFGSIQNKEDLSAVLVKAKEQLLSFVTKGISPKDADYQLARDFVAQRADDTFKRIEHYWHLLLQEE